MPSAGIICGLGRVFFVSRLRTTSPKNAMGRYLATAPQQAGVALPPRRVPAHHPKHKNEGQQYCHAFRKPASSDSRHQYGTLLVSQCYVRVSDLFGQKAVRFDPGGALQIQGRGTGCQTGEVGSPFLFCVWGCLYLRDARFIAFFPGPVVLNRVYSGGQPLVRYGQGTGRLGAGTGSLPDGPLLSLPQSHYKPRPCISLLQLVRAGISDVNLRCAQRCGPKR
jgi:hypothetical protein